MPEILAAAQAGQQAALVFGNETFGLDTDEVRQCNRLMTIAGNPDYFSLNLSQAVQVVCYELFSQTDADLSHLMPGRNPAAAEQVEGMVRHLGDTLEGLGFFRRRNGERMMRRLHALFRRAEPDSEDIDILRGFFRTVQNRLPKDQNR